MIYLDSAATSLLRPPSVGEAVLKAMQTFGNPGRGSHPAALNATRCVLQARQAVSDLLGSTPDQIVFTSNATESLNLTLHGLLSPEDHVITTALEHNSVLRPLYRLQAQGMGLSVIDIDGKGALDYDGLHRCLRKNTKAVVCTHAGNLTGLLVNLNIIAEFCSENNLLFILDAAQTAGVYPIHAAEMGIDVLCFTGHKGLLGPQGTGGLCIRHGLTIAPLKVGGGGIKSYAKEHPQEMPESLEAGTLNTHGIAGLLAGIQYIRKTGLDIIRNRELMLSKQFIDGISDIEGIQVYRNTINDYAPIVALNVSSLNSGEVADILAVEYGICVRAGAHCAPLAHIALGTREQGAVRFSFSSFNTEDEVQTAIEALSEITRIQR